MSGPNPGSASARSHRFERILFGTVLGLIALAVILVTLLVVPGFLGLPQAGCLVGLLVALMMGKAFLVHKESRRSRDRLCETFEGRTPLSDEEFGRRFYQGKMALIATRLRELLAEHVRADLSRLLPEDDVVGMLEQRTWEPMALGDLGSDIEAEFEVSLRDDEGPALRTFDQIVKRISENMRGGW